MVEQTEQPLGDVAFTHRWYRLFLERLLEEGYEFRAFTDRLEGGDVVLRHDVDLSVEAAVRMARLEAEMDVRSTYCVLLTSPLYNPFERPHREALREIDALGHDVVLHFSTHTYWSADDSPSNEAIERRVKEERSILEALVPSSRTVSFHRPPPWVLDREFESFTSTYAPAYFSDIGYLADSSQRWREEPPRIDALPETLQVLAHPGLWDTEDGTFERRIEQRVTEACRHADSAARKEFIDGGAGDDV